MLAWLQAIFLFNTGMANKIGPATEHDFVVSRTDFTVGLADIFVIDFVDNHITTIGRDGQYRVLAPIDYRTAASDNQPQNDQVIASHNGKHKE